MVKCLDVIGELEAQLTFHQDSIDELNTTVAAQLREIENLQHEIEQLKETIQQMMQSQPAGTEAEPPPAHY